MDSIEEHPQDSPITSINTITTMDDEIHDNIDAEIDEEKWISATSSTSHTQRHYQSLLNCIFQERPIIRRQGGYDIEDPTVHVREKLIVFCQELVEAVKTRFEDTPSIFLSMK
ncbi:unnamed protein product, partial [Rotaria magnacalcarata]